MKTLLNLSFFVGGLALFVYLILKIGPDAIGKNIVLLGPYWLWVFAFSFGWHLAHTKAWQDLLGTAGMSFWSLFRIRLVGVVASSLTPLSFIAGDSLRHHLLNQKKNIKNAPALLWDRFLNTYASAIFIVICFLLLVTRHVFHFLESTLQTFLLILIFSVTVWLFLKLLFWIRTHPLTWFGKFLPQALKERLANPQSTKIPDQSLTKAYCYHFLGKTFGLLEIYVISVALDAPFTFDQTLGFGLSSVAIQALPQDIGLMEAGFWGIAEILATTATLALSLQFMRRIRQFFWLGVGFIVGADFFIRK